MQSALGSQTPFAHRLASGISLLLIVLVFARIAIAAYQLPYFVDEMTYNEAAFHLFKFGNYSSQIFQYQPFVLAVSTGIAATWPAGLAWVLGGPLLSARVLVGLYEFILFATLIWFFTKRRGYEVSSRLLAVASAWVLFTRIPYWHGFILSLGELPGALFVGWGLYLLRGRPLLAFFLWGVSCWLTKMFYLPVCLVLGGVYVLQVPGTFCAKLKAAARGGASFLAPAILWVLVVGFFYGLSSAVEWIPKALQTGFRISWSWGHAATLESARLPVSLSERLSSAQYEWVRTSLSDHVKILGLLFIPLVISFISITKQKIFNFSQGEKYYILAVTSLVSLFGVWWFFLHPFLWIRHLQPALILSFGLIFYCAHKLVEAARHKKLKCLNLQGSWRIFWQLTLLILIGQSIFANFAPAPREKTYSLRCQASVTSDACWDK